MGTRKTRNKKPPTKRGVARKDKDIKLRRKDIKEMIINDAPRREIIDEISTKYNLSKTTIAKDWTLINEEVLKQIDDDSELIIKDHITKYNKIYEINFNNGNHKVALQALSQKEKLLELKTNNFKGNTQNIINFNNGDFLENHFNGLDMNDLLKIKNIIISNDKEKK